MLEKHRYIVSSLYVKKLTYVKSGIVLFLIQNRNPADIFCENCMEKENNLKNSEMR